MVNEQRRKELDIELKVLSQAVTEASAARTKWMDDHMEDYSKFRVGDEIYDVNCCKLGVVTGLYRYHDSMTVDCRYKPSRDYGFPYEDNTSRQCSYFYTKEEAAAELKRRHERLTQPEKTLDEVLSEISKQMSDRLSKTLDELIKDLKTDAEVVFSEEQNVNIS
jgi:hypothetical protein